MQVPESMAPRYETDPDYRDLCVVAHRFVNTPGFLTKLEIEARNRILELFFNAKTSEELLRVSGQSDGMIMVLGLLRDMATEVDDAKDRTNA